MCECEGARQRAVGLGAHRAPCGRLRERRAARVWPPESSGRVAVGLGGRGPWGGPRRVRGAPRRARVSGVAVREIGESAKKLSSGKLTTVDRGPARAAAFHPL